MRYLITGGSGYIGTRLVELLSRRGDTEKIVIADVVPPEVEVLPELVHWQSLRDPPSAWAATVDRAQRLHGVRAAARPDWKTRFNIDCSVRWLQRLYTEADLTCMGMAS